MPCSDIIFKCGQKIGQTVLILRCDGNLEHEFMGKFFCLLLGVLGKSFFGSFLEFLEKVG